MGLGLGAIFLAAGMGEHVRESAQARVIAEAAARGYTGSYLEAQGRGLRAGLQLYGFQPDSDAATVSARHDDGRGSVKVRRQAELQCLTEAVYYEARSENARGQAAVAQVVLNRVKHPAFPKTVCGVVFQGAGRHGCQFSFTCDGSMRRGRDIEAWNKARKVAGRALAGVVVVNIGRATHYHTAEVSPFWAPQMLRVAQVGAHVFYRFSPNRLHAAPPGDPVMQQAVLTSTPLDQPPQLRLESALVEKTIETSLQPASPASPEAPKPVAAKPPEPSLSAPQPVAGTS
jgi:spore germination cell wall hydrolase CwlJ-like protein